MNRKQLLKRLAQGRLHNVNFNDMINLVKGFGFNFVRISGSHHIYSYPDVPEMVNLQSVNGEAKPYQIKQFLKLVERHNLKLEDSE